MAALFVQIAEQLNRRPIIASEVIACEGEKLHLWGVHGGTTILLRQKGQHFCEWKELPEPLGVVTAQYKKKS